MPWSVNTSRLEPNNSTAPSSVAESRMRSCSGWVAHDQLAKGEFLAGGRAHRHHGDGQRGRSDQERRDGVAFHRSSGLGRAGEGGLASLMTRDGSQAPRAGL
jgi:hypothetical protein